jgi:hypothetical protein
LNLGLYCTVQCTEYVCLRCAAHAALLCLVAPYLSPFLSTCTVEFSGCLLVLYGLNLEFYDYTVLYNVLSTLYVQLIDCLLCVTHAAVLCLVAPYLSPFPSTCTVQFSGCLLLGLYGLNLGFYD